MPGDLPEVGVRLTVDNVAGFDNALNSANRRVADFAANIERSFSNIGKTKSTSFVKQIEQDFDKLNRLSSGGLRINFVDQIEKQLDAVTGKMASGIKGTGGVTSWLQTIQDSVNRLGGLKVPTSVLDGIQNGFGELNKSAQQTSSVIVDSVGKSSKATVTSSDVIAVANNRVISSYAQMAATVVSYVSKMVVSIANAIGAMVRNTINAIGSIASGIGGVIGGAGGILGGAVGGIGGILQNIVNWTKSLGNNSKDAARGIDEIGKSAENANRPLSFLQHSLATGFGVAMERAAQFVASKINWMVGQFFQSTLDYQNAQVGLIGLLQRELTRAGADIADALEPATKQAAWLTKELSNIAILSPYKMADVQQLFKESMAFGQSAIGAKQFTKDILNIAAGLGASNDMLQRMAYNFSQIGMEGSISALNLRQLAQAGFDLTEVIETVGKATGVAMKTNDDFNASITSGQITWEDFDRALTEISETRFPGAADRMARTLFGLKNNIEDFFNLTVPLLTLPAADAVAARANIIFNKFVEFRSSGVMEALGVMFGEWAGKTMDSLGVLAEQTSSFFGGIANAAYDWGGNIIISLAEGIVDTVSWALGNAFSVVSDVISYWLQPHSPPNVAPDLPIWGADLLDEWLGGFKDADWSAFEGITKPLKSIFDLLGTDIFGSIGARVAQALSDIAKFGFSDIDIIAEVAAATGDFGVEMAKLVRIQLDYAASAKAVEDADKRITTGEQKLTKLVYEYNKMRRAGVSPAMLRAKGLEVESTKDEIYLAKKQKIEEEARIKLLKEQLALQEKLVNALIDFSKQQEKANKEAERNARESAGKDNFPNTLPRVQKPSIWPDMTGPDMDKIKNSIMAKWNEIFKPLLPLQAKWNTLLAITEMNIRRLKSSLSDLWKNIKNGFSMLNPGLARLAIWMSADGKKINDSIRKFGDQIFWLAGLVLNTLGEAWKRVWPLIVKSWDILINWIFNNGDRVEGIFKKWSDVIQKIGDYVSKNLSPAFVTLVELIATRLLGNINLLLLALDGIMLLLSGDWKGAWSLWSKAGEDAIQGIKDSINGAWAAFSDWWEGKSGRVAGKEQMAGVWKSITDTLGGALAGAWAAFSNWWAVAPPGGLSGEESISLIARVMGQRIGDALSGAWTAFSNWWSVAPKGGKSGQEALTDIAKKIGNELEKTLTGAWTGMIVWYDANQHEMWKGIWDVAIDLFTKLAVPVLISTFKLAWDAFVSGIEVITVKLSLFLENNTPFNVTGQNPWGIKGENRTTVEDWLKPTPGEQENANERTRMWNELWDNLGVSLGLFSKNSVSEYNNLWAGIGSVNQIMMPSQKSTWDLFWDTTNIKFTTITDAVTLTWNTMWDNIENFFVTRRVALYFAWNDFWSSVTRLWNAWTKDISDSWDNFWNGLRDNLSRWKDDNIDILFGLGRAIMNGVIGGLRDAVETMTGIGQMLINAIWNEIKERLFGGGGGGTPPPPPAGKPGSDNGMASGGIIHKPWWGRVGEFGKAEAVLPLESSRSVHLLSRALSQAMRVNLNPVVVPYGGGMNGAGSSVIYNQNLYVNTTQPAVNVAQSYESMRALFSTY